VSLLPRYNAALALELSCPFSIARVGRGKLAEIRKIRDSIRQKIEEWAPRIKLQQ